MKKLKSYTILRRTVISESTIVEAPSKKRAIDILHHREIIQRQPAYWRPSSSRVYKETSYTIEK